jgi:hypothetical protein
MICEVTMLKTRNAIMLEGLREHSGIPADFIDDEIMPRLRSLNPAAADLAWDRTKSQFDEARFDHCGHLLKYHLDKQLCLQKWDDGCNYLEADLIDPCPPKAADFTDLGVSFDGASFARETVRENDAAL